MVQVVAVEIGRQRLGAEVAQSRVSRRIRACPQHGAKAPRVVQAQYGRIGEPQFDVVVLTARRSRVHDAQAAGHAEVDDQRAVLERDQDVFRAPADIHDLLTLKVLQRRHRPTQSRFVDQRLDDALPDDMRRYAAAGGLYLRELGHVQGSR